MKNAAEWMYTNVKHIGSVPMEKLITDRESMPHKNNDSKAKMKEVIRFYKNLIRMKLLNETEIIAATDKLLFLLDGQVSTFIAWTSV